MYIGSSRHCKEYCQEEDRRKFDKYHEEHRHTILDEKTFKEENKDFMRKSKRAWNSFAIRLESFFKKLKKQIEFIENQARDRLDYEEVKTAISTSDKYLAKITTDIMQERYRNLTCQDIEEFICLRKKQQNLSHLGIDQEEREFALDIIEQLQQSLLETTQDLKATFPTKHRTEYHPDKMYKKEREDRTAKREPRQPNQKLDSATQRYKRTNRSFEDHNDLSATSTPTTKNKVQTEGRKKYRKRYEEEKKHEIGNDSHQPSEGETGNEGPCQILKISELTENSKAFTIQVRLVHFIKELYDKELWRVSDETGQIKLVIPSHSLLKSGALITLKNCYVKAFSRSLQVHTKQTTKISSENFREQVLKPHNNTKIHRQKRYNRQDKKQAGKQKGLSKIDDINPQSKQIKLIAKVLKIVSVPTSKDTSRCVLGDETGIITCQFVGFQSILKENSVIYIRGANAQVDKEGHIFLSGKRILMEPAHDGIDYIKESNDVSSRQYEEVEI